MMLDCRFLTTADQLFALFPAGFKLTLNHLFLHIFTLLSLCRCWACSAPVSYCAGEVTTRHTSCWSPLTATHEGSIKAEPRRRAEQIKRSVTDISTLDSRCSYTSSSTPCTNHNIVANTDNVAWVGAGFKGKTIFIYMLSE